MVVSECFYSQFQENFWTVYFFVWSVILLVSRSFSHDWKTHNQAPWLAITTGPALTQETFVTGPHRKSNLLSKTNTFLWSGIFCKDSIQDNTTKQTGRKKCSADVFVYSHQGGVISLQRNKFKAPTDLVSWSVTLNYMQIRSFSFDVFTVYLEHFEGRSGEIKEIRPTIFEKCDSTHTDSRWLCGSGNGLLFHVTQPISKSTIKAIACSKPTISEN